MNHSNGSKSTAAACIVYFEMKKHQIQFPRQHKLLWHRENKQQPPYIKTDAARLQEAFIVAASHRVLCQVRWFLPSAFHAHDDTHLTVSPPSWPLMRPVPHASPLEVTAAKKTRKQKDFLRKQWKETGYQTTAVLMLLKSSLFTAKHIGLQKFGAWRTGGPSQNPTSWHTLQLKGFQAFRKNPRELYQQGTSRTIHTLSWRRIIVDISTLSPTTCLSFFTSSPRLIFLLWQIHNHTNKKWFWIPQKGRWLQSKREKMCIRP